MMAELTDSTNISMVSQQSLSCLLWTYRGICSGLRLRTHRLVQWGRSKLSTFPKAVKYL